MEMPSGAQSIPKKHLPVLKKHRDGSGREFWVVGKGDVLTEETAQQLSDAYVRQMKDWSNFEAAVVMLRDGKELRRQHVSGLSDS
jgi:hypothetical protein